MMSTNLPEPSAPDASGGNRWTPQAVIGLLCIVAAVVIEIAFGLPSDIDSLAEAARRAAHAHTELGEKLSTALWALGGSLGIYAKPPPPIVKPGGKGGGGGMSGLIIGLVLAISGFAFAGCASLSERRYARLEWETIQGKAGPASCEVVFFGDGREVGRLYGEVCPPPETQCAPGVPE